MRRIVPIALLVALFLAAPSRADVTSDVQLDWSTFSISFIPSTDPWSATWNSQEGFVDASVSSPEGFFTDGDFAPDHTTYISASVDDGLSTPLVSSMAERSSTLFARQVRSQGGHDESRQLQRLLLLRGQLWRADTRR